MPVVRLEGARGDRLRSRLIGLASHVLATPAVAGLFVGRSNRHRINRARHANSAVCTLVLDQRTHNCVTRRTTEDISTKDSVRCLERRSQLQGSGAPRRPSRVS
ncbi:hypothetical protein GCM10010515_25740 [Streptomyces fructofermentans]|uniref:Uncharacterized protein n=1 Tax=Streptomyces fructofermentans TaxID=152141 RepID=A0A918NBW1_9ACTN|nr:hypothetical protein GCM10010515_25740 [Streptomyces fructofermentans]